MSPDGVVVTCPSCRTDTRVTAEDRGCDHCGERVPDSAIEPLEPPVGRGPETGGGA